MGYDDFNASAESSKVVRDQALVPIESSSVPLRIRSSYAFCLPINYGMPAVNNCICCLYVASSQSTSVSPSQFLRFDHTEREQGVLLRTLLPHLHARELFVCQHILRAKPTLSISLGVSSGPSGHRRRRNPPAPLHRTFPGITHTERALAAGRNHHPTFPADRRRQHRGLRAPDPCSRRR